MRELGSGLFFFGFSLFVLWGSLQVGLGTLQKPDSGFLTFCTGVILAALSVVLICKGWKMREGRKAALSSRRVVLALITLIIYSLILDPLGFIVPTSFLMAIFFHLGQPRRWWALWGMSALVTFLVYLVFGILLQVHLPRGIVGI